MATLLTNTFEFETGFELYPKLKVIFIDESHYIINVNTISSDCLIILKDISMTGFAYLSNRIYILPHIDGFDNKKHPFEKTISELTEKDLKRHHSNILKESSEELTALLITRHIKNEENEKN